MQLKTDEITAELAQLNTKRESLRKFVQNTEKYSKLDSVKAILLVGQLQIMGLYAGILEKADRGGD